MTTTTQITQIDATFPREWLGDYAADFDLDALDRDYVAALDAAAKQQCESLSVHANGMVFADVADCADVKAIDWKLLADEINVDEIAQRHDFSDAARVEVETDAPFTAAADIATLVLARGTNPSQTGRLGVMFTLHGRDAMAVTSALRDAGHTAWAERA
jgi:hypothetical protein